MYVAKNYSLWQQFDIPLVIVCVHILRVTCIGEACELASDFKDT